MNTDKPTEGVVEEKGNGEYCIARNPSLPSSPSPWQAGPDPLRHFFWYASENGRPIRVPPGGRVPAEADYWTQEVMPEWVKVPKFA